MSLFGLGGPELLVIGAVAAVLFGPSKLPELGRSAGKTVQSFKNAAEEFKDEMNKAATEEEQAAAAAAKEVATADKPPFAKPTEVVMPTEKKQE